jgi:rod shape-determining protein MreC
MKKLNILALLIFVAAVVSVFMLHTPTTRMIQGKVMAVLSPFIHSSAAVEQGMSEALSSSDDPRELKREKDRLQIDNERLQIISQKYSRTLDENNYLRELIAFKKVSPFKVCWTDWQQTRLLSVPMD